MRLSISTLPLVLSFMKFFVAQTFWVEFPLDDVLEVLLVVGLNFIFYKTCRSSLERNKEERRKRVIEVSKFSIRKLKSLNKKL